MKKVIALVVLSIILVGCTKVEYDTSIADIDPDLNQQVKNALAEMGILDELKFKKFEYEEIEEINALLEEEGSGRLYLFETEYEEVEMVISVHVYSGEWTLTGISDPSLDNAYWANEDQATFFDIFDWRTGELLRKGSFPFEND